MPKIIIDLYFSSLYLLKMDFVDSSFYMTNDINTGYYSLNDSSNTSDTTSSFYENLWVGDRFEDNSRVISALPNSSSFYVGYC
jgi:hypothetical protein